MIRLYVDKEFTDKDEIAEWLCLRAIEIAKGEEEGLGWSIFTLIERKKNTLNYQTLNKLSNRN